MSTVPGTSQFTGQYCLPNRGWHYPKAVQDDILNESLERADRVADDAKIDGARFTALGGADALAGQFIAARRA
jgi:hypothetical protein